MVWLLILYFSLALGISFLCSLMEAVILSVSPAYITILENERPRTGKRLREYKDNIDQPLSAILTLNTFANTIGAAGVGAQAYNLSGDNVIAALVSIFLALMILIFSEIIPKTIGAVHWKKLAPPATHIIGFFIFILKPIVIVLKNISNLLSRNSDRSKISREEIIATAKIGQKQGTLLRRENRIIQNILCLKNIRAKDVLTPRSVLTAFNKDQTVSEVVQSGSVIRFSRIPIYGKDLDDITGFVLRYKILLHYLMSTILKN